MLKLYNSLTQKIEEFTPITDKKVGMYVCGPTVYGPCHLGHARTWIFFDWLRRYLIYKGYKVKFVQNITDVGHLVGDGEEGEDKIEKEAKLEDKSPLEIARFYENAYLKDLHDLNILKPDISPRATEHIKDIIDYIKVLIAKGSAYEVKGNVYFDVEQFSQYGKLSRRTLDEVKENTRVARDPLKKNQADFALWLRADKEVLQKWPSPWGEGFPGWHIECSVMAKKHLGCPIDIHGSGTEHIFPHHENEIAQSESYEDCQFVRYFLHAGMLNINGNKMSKSQGNYFTVQDALVKNKADTIKLAFLATFWRKPYDYTENAISEARKLKDKLVRAKRQALEKNTGFKEELEEALDDDFNGPKAMAVINKNINNLAKSDVVMLEKIFGLVLKDEIEITADQKKILSDREKARKRGEFKEADRLRDILVKDGVVVEDSKIKT